MPEKSSALVKVVFVFQKDDVGWPPVERESVWASDLGYDRFQLDNTPFFARGVAWKDIVLAKEADGELIFERVLEHLGHSTVRVFCQDPSKRDEVSEALKGMGCSYEGIPQYQMVAFDVPPTADLEFIRKYLARGEERGEWAYDEGLLAQ